MSDCGMGSRRLQGGTARPETARPVLRANDFYSMSLIVEFRRVLVLLVALGVVRHEHLTALAVPYVLDPLIPLENANRVVSETDARQEVLLQVFRQVDGVAGQHDRARLG